VRRRPRGNALVLALLAGALATIALASRYFTVFGPLCLLAALSWAAATVWYSRRG
jgi:4-amino-4-deoxy-L-arabinose transferase-like glycosyltransferase